MEIGLWKRKKGRRAFTTRPAPFRVMRLMMKEALVQGAAGLGSSPDWMKWSTGSTSRSLVRLTARV